jgi:hypothetical protein
MGEPSVEIADIIIDCADSERLARFWADLLGRSIEGGKGFVRLADTPEGRSRNRLPESGGTESRQWASRPPVGVAQASGSVSISGTKSSRLEVRRLWGSNGTSTATAGHASPAGAQTLAGTMT